MTEQFPQEIRRPGRPAKQAPVPQPVKKGKRSWKPASLNEFINKEEGYTYRMIRKDPTNLANKAAEGWEIVSGMNGADTKHVDPGRMNDGKSLTSVQEGKDWVLGRIPNELADERNEYFRSETNRRTAGLTAHIKKDLGKEGAQMHGNITISSRNSEQVIE